MGGGLMQLVAYGAQDIYLTGNPQITFFKVVYRRHTNFSMESILQTFNGTAVNGGRQTATISRNGDLISRMYLEFTSTISTGGDKIFNPGTGSIKDVELEIGGQLIDKQRGDWMEAWAELTEPNPAGIIGNASDAFTAKEQGTKYQNLAKSGGVSVDIAADKTNVKARVPLSFWFCRNPGLALPLIALQYHEVKLIVNWSSTKVRIKDNSTPELWVDYIYLDTDERRRFAQVSHEYLIEQVQHQQDSSTPVDLVFNHPVKELVWFREHGTDNSRHSLSSASTVRLALNGHDRFAERPMEYFTKTQVWQHHTGTPLDLTTAISTGFGTGNAGRTAIGVYSFALKPEEHQPSGTCNFSRIDNAQFKFTTAKFSIH